MGRIRTRKEWERFLIETENFLYKSNCIIGKPRLEETSGGPQLKFLFEAEPALKSDQVKQGFI